MFVYNIHSFLYVSKSYTSKNAVLGIDMVNMNNNYQNIIRVIILSLFVLGCDKQDTGDKPEMPAMPVSVLIVQPATVPISTEAVAQTEGAKEVEIRPRVGGILLKKLFEEGAEIIAGQPMFQIDPVPFELAASQARAQLANKKARLTQTQREAERLKSLVATKSISQREYDNASSDESIANASLQESNAVLREAELNLSYAKVIAPVSGIAGRFLLSEGALVNANTSLLTTIIQTSPIWVRFSLSDYELKQLGGRLANDIIENIAVILPDGSVYPESGKLNFSASNIDPALGTLQLRAEFKNADKKLIPGQFVRVKVTTGQKEGVFLVPQTAVMTGEQGKFLFVAEKDKDGNVRANVRAVEVGNWQGQDWVVLSGLSAGDQVIIDHLIKLRPGAAVLPKMQQDNGVNKQNPPDSNTATQP
jgi:membrane fusion protein (multidrug efflux system)